MLGGGGGDILACGRVGGGGIFVFQGGGAKIGGKGKTTKFPSGVGGGGEGVGGIFFIEY